MNDRLPKIALPAGGILSAQLTQGNPHEVTVRFDDPMAALRFSASVRHEIKPKASQHHHVILNEEIGDRSNAHHFVLVVNDGQDPAECADYMAATLDGEPDEDEDLPRKTDRGYQMDLGTRFVSVLRVRALDSVDGEALARHLPVRHSDEMVIRDTESRSTTETPPRG